MHSTYPLSLDITIEGRLDITEPDTMILSQTLTEKIAAAIRKNFDLQNMLVVRSHGLMRAHWRGVLNGKIISILGSVNLAKEDGRCSAIADLDIYVGDIYVAQVEEIHFISAEPKSVVSEGRLMLVRSV